VSVEAHLKETLGQLATFPSTEVGYLSLLDSIFAAERSVRVSERASVSPLSDTRSTYDASHRKRGNARGRPPR
jgi:hypothetical protein